MDEYYTQQVSKHLKEASRKFKHEFTIKVYMKMSTKWHPTYELGKQTIYVISILSSVQESSKHIKKVHIKQLFVVRKTGWTIYVLYSASSHLRTLITVNS